MSFSNEQPLISQQEIWKAVSLKKIIHEIVQDARFKGLSTYIVNIKFFWSRQIPTACAGHGFIFFNPDFFDKIPEESRKTVIAHEIWHLILRHLDRGKKYDPYIFNEAADYVINNSLLNDGFTFDGTDALLNPLYGNQSTEEVYKQIWKENKKLNKSSIKENHITSEQIEDLIDKAAKQENPASSLEDQKEKAEKILKKHQENIGRKTANKQIILEVTSEKIKILESTFPEIFKDYLTDPLTGGKRTFLRPNRRQHNNSSSLRLPGRFPKRGEKNRLTHLVYALDVSGSINQKQAKQFNQSVFTIKSLLNPSKLTVLFFDTKIVLEKTFRDIDTYTDITVKAGGGTNLTDVYKRTRELKPEALVVFTDLMVNIPPKEEWESIWLIPEKTTRVPHNIYGKIYLIPDFKK